MKTDAWGIAEGYEDAHEIWRTTSISTREALRAAMGAPASGGAPPASPVRIVRPGLAATWPAGELTLEDGATLRIAQRLPRDLPLGYHRFVPQSSDDAWLIVATPGQCVLPKRGWGWAAQLYATRSRRSWGFGDLGDLRSLGQWAAGTGANLLLINPLHAPAPVIPQQRSPYYPSSRLFRNPLYLSIEQVPGASEQASALEPLASAAAALNSERLLDHDRVFTLKMQALEMLWSRFGASESFEHYCREQGQALGSYAAYCVLAESHGADWRRWPAEYRRADDPAVARFVEEHRARVDFHRWLQWLLDEQLAAAAEALPIVQDLPIGVDPGGADAWVWQDVLATGTHVGAPPDIHIPTGQDWGLPPWIPHRLQAVGYEPFIQTLRASLRHAAGLRIDHALGLFRLFWVPAGRSPAEGGYVRYPYEEMLAIIALESHRAGAFIVGEDLGTVERFTQQELARHGLLSYRVLWFETERPGTFPKLSLASVTTHDLPTAAGLWSGEDLRVRQSLGLSTNDEAAEEMRTRVGELAGLDESMSLEEAVGRIHALLAEAASLVKLATLEDAFALLERPNIPNGGDVWPNWSLALPWPIEEFDRGPLAGNIARLLSQSSASEIA